MKKVIRTKNFSLPQSLNIVRNLQQKFKECSSVNVDPYCYSSGILNIEYRLYVAGVHHKVFKTWPALLDKYEELMEE